VSGRASSWLIAGGAGIALAVVLFMGPRAGASVQRSPAPGSARIGTPQVSLEQRSLLVCESETACDICPGVAQLAAQMVEQGSSWQEIRRAIDTRFGS
jgi:hypothetical protein